MAILIVEDDERVSTALSALLRKEGHTTIRAADGAEALAALNAETEVVLLDLGLPDMDGVDVCRQIRSHSGVPIIIATARNHVEERIRGLRAGADDFLVKPYDVRELLARIEAVTRRTSVLQPGHENTVAIGELTVDHVSRQLRVAGVDVELTRKEFDIMAVLVRYPGVVVSRERIIREVWNSDWHAFSRSLEVHMASLRRKLGSAHVIETVRGVGYRLVVG